MVQLMFPNHLRARSQISNPLIDQAGVGKDGRIRAGVVRLPRQEVASGGIENLR